MKLKSFLITLALTTVFCSVFVLAGSTAKAACNQVPTLAKNFLTGECQTFATPCDVPTGWQEVASCSTSTCISNWRCSVWSPCVYGIRTRTCPDINNCGPTAVPPPLVELCTGCTPNWQCGSWPTCVNNQQNRTCIDYNSCGVDTGKPAVTQSCVSIPACTESNWTFSLSPAICPLSGQQTKTWSSADCSGGVGHPASETVTCNYQVPTCTSFTYSDWSNCNQSGIQTRTVASSAPAGCTGGDPITSRSCSCTSNWSCATWSACTNSKQTRICTDENSCGDNSGKPIETQSCSVFCTDSDGGKNYSKLGTVSGQYFGAYNDYCSGGSSLAELYCESSSSTNYKTQFYNCSNGCQNGACRGCTPYWQCTDWSACVNGQQTKTCTDSNNCGVATGKPAETQSCLCAESNWTYAMSPLVCPSSGTQTKTWTKIGTCTGGISHPATEIATCTYSPGKSILVNIANSTPSGFKPDDTLNITWSSSGLTAGTKVNIVLLGLYGTGDTYDGDYYVIANYVPVEQGNYSFKLQSSVVKDIYKAYKIWVGEYPVTGGNSVGIPPLKTGLWTRTTTYVNGSTSYIEGPASTNCTGCLPADVTKQTYGQVSFNIAKPLVEKIDFHIDKFEYLSGAKAVRLFPKEKMTFTWSYNSYENKKVNIILLRNDQGFNPYQLTPKNKYFVIASDIDSNSGKYDWQPSAEFLASIAPSVFYPYVGSSWINVGAVPFQIFIGEYDPPAQNGDWDSIQAFAYSKNYAIYKIDPNDRNTFEIANKYIKSQTPLSGQVINLGDTVNISYTASEKYFVQYGMQDIVLVDVNKGTYKVIVRGKDIYGNKNLIDGNFYSWKVSNDILPGDNSFRIWTGDLNVWFSGEWCRGKDDSRGECPKIPDEGLWKSWGADDVIEGPTWTKSALFSIHGDTANKFIRIFTEKSNGKVNISWSSLRVDKINIVLLKVDPLDLQGGNNYSYMVIDKDVSASLGFYSWTIPDNIDGAYKIFIGEYKPPYSTGDWGYVGYNQGKRYEMGTIIKAAHSGSYAESGYLNLSKNQQNNITNVETLSSAETDLLNSLQSQIAYLIAEIAKLMAQAAKK